MNRILPILSGPGAFRLFLAFVVVVHHSFPLRAGGWAVYMFFVLSGYWISRMWNGKYRNTRQPYLTFIVSRWWRLFPVFLLALILVALNARLLNQVSSGALSPDWWLRQLPIIGSTSAGRILPPTWSLDVEMQFYLLAPAIIWLALKLRAGVLFGFAFLLVGATLLSFANGISEEASLLPVFLGFFLCGIFLDRIDWRPRGNLALLSLGGFILLTIVLLLIPYTRGGIWHVGSESLMGLADHPAWPHALWVVGVVLCLPFITWNVKQPSGKLDMWLANLAYPLYLIHWIPREWYYHFLSDGTSPLTRILLLAGNFILAFALAVAIDVTVDRWFNKRRASWVKSRKSANPSYATIAEVNL